MTNDVELKADERRFGGLRPECYSCTHARCKIEEVYRGVVWHSFSYCDIEYGECPFQKEDET
jgi:hypothetical protein|nr:MAG TPA: hypothetical protein [Caudoviricetes sp.]